MDYKFLLSEFACSSVDLGLSMVFPASLIVVLERKIVQRRAVRTEGARGDNPKATIAPIDFIRNRNKTISFKKPRIIACPSPPEF